MKAFIEKIHGFCGKIGIKPKMLVFLIVVLVVGIWIGKSISPEKSKIETTVTKTEAKPQVWTCSMHPQIKLPKPGLCPICSMELIPVSTDETEAGASLRQLTVSENAKKLMDIEVAPVERKFVNAVVRMVGKVDYDETRYIYITAWVPGRLDRLYVDYTGVRVNKGDHMVYLYSPELISAQEELLQAIEAVKNIQKTELGIMREMTESMANAAREKLRLWGLTPEQIIEIETTGQVTDHMTIYSPASGIVIHKNGLEGMYVKEGTRIYTIADLSLVWVKLDAYESDLQWLRYGQKVEFTTVSYPGEVFTGTIAFIDPILNDKTRTVKIRVNVQNPDGRLKPNMFVKAVVRAQMAGGGKIMDADLVGKWICPMHPEIIKPDSGICDICQMPLVTTESQGYISDELEQAEKPLVIPVNAALVTGTRAIVYVELPDTEVPTFEGREILLGPRAGDYYLVRSGLKINERVVVKGNFKIDSDLQIMARPSMMTPDGAGIGLSGEFTELPAQLQYQLQLVLTAAQEAQKTLASEDITKIQPAFTALEQSIKDMDMKILTSETHALWMEIAMRLANDAMEGIDVRTPEDINRVAGSLSDNIKFLMSSFGFESKVAEKSRPAVSAEFRNQLANVFVGYFNMHHGLTEDDPEAAAEAAKQTLTAIKAVEMKLLTGEDHILWMKYSIELKNILADATKAVSLESSRESFSLLSQHLIKVAKRFGSTADKLFYILNCPMAFDNKGAQWLQDNDQTSNPYFGQMMLRCGGVEEVISVKEIWEKKDK